MSEDNPPSTDQTRVAVQTVATTPPPPPGYLPPGYAGPAQPGKGRTILGRLMVSLVTALLLFSLVLNAYLWLFFSSVTGGPHEVTYEAGNAKNRIVIVPIKGMINAEMAAFVRSSLRHLRNNLPRAVIFRIDSGGGGIAASDQIWHELDRFKQDPDVQDKQVKIVASFGGMAASGGYYVATPADYIMAERTTITGSIGVVAMGFEVKDMLDKIGVTPEVLVASGSPNKDVGSYLRKWRPEDRQRLLRLIDDAHSRFKEVVTSGRQHKLTQSVESLADGDLFTAAQASANGLADAVGYLSDAIAKAAELAGIDELIKPQVTVLSPPYRLNLTHLLGGRKSAPAPGVEQMRDWFWELTAPRIAYQKWP